MKSKIIPLITASTDVVFTACLILSLSLCPMRFAITTLAPMEQPTNRLMMRLMSAVFAPTAANASLLANLPTMATSIVLKSCCKMLEKANGMANIRILPTKGPCSMSISLFLAIPSFSRCKVTDFSFSKFIKHTKLQEKFIPEASYVNFKMYYFFAVKVYVPEPTLMTA